MSIKDPAHAGIPTTIGVILDGNRRYAKREGLTTPEGHLAGFENFKKFIRYAREAGIKHVIAYCFSTENWKRSELEVSALLSLFRKALSEAGRQFDEGVGITCIGDIEKFPKDIVAEIKKVNAKQHACDLTVHLALSYGSRSEIAHALKKIMEKDIKPEAVSEDVVAQHLFTAGIPDPDLIIRTGGEERLSNFLLWQAAYSELFFTKTLWPDFTKEEFMSILEEYAKRQRRFGV